MLQITKNTEGSRQTRVVSALLVLALVSLAGRRTDGAEQGSSGVKTNHQASGEANPGSVSVTTNYYRFAGTNHTQMRAEMREAQPWKGKFGFDAQTKWDVHSRYRVRREAGQFVLDSLEVRTKVVITLPWWIPGRPVARDLVERWNKCVNGLSRHEQGHLVLAEAAGTEVKKRLLALPAHPSPQELTAAADKTVAETLEEFRERERRYDEVTRHGFTQGAVFPMTPADVKWEERVAASP